MPEIRVDSNVIVNSIGAGLCLLDRDLRILWVNNQQANWFGSSAQLLGRHCYEMFKRHNHICRGCPTVKVFKTGQIHKANRINFTAQGKKHYYQVTVSPVQDDNNRVIFALELVHDVTEKTVKERSDFRIAQRVKRMYSHLYSVNKRLQRNIHRLKEITHNMSRFKCLMQRKYRRKVSELITVKEELQNVFKVSRSLCLNIDLKKISSLITRLTCDLMHSDACVLRLLDEHKKILVAYSGCGMSSKFLKQTSVIKVDQTLAGLVASTRKAVIIDDINADTGIKCRELLKQEGVRSVLCVPVIYQEKVLGVITAYSKKLAHFTEGEMGVLMIFASQVALGIQESKHYEDIHRNYFNTIHTLALALEARDPYTRGHTERVTRFSVEVGRALQVAPVELTMLRYAAEVHDIGKVSVPDFILGKPGKLTLAERAIIEYHPIKGAEVLEPLDFLKPALPIVRHHHEKYDGSGYPDGLAKDKIPFFSRILACADAFDAMTSDRPYRRNRLRVEEAFKEIKDHAGSQFDPRITGLFIKSMEKLQGSPCLK